MAGIGFELEKILKRDTYTSLIHAYSYAILISSGPWLFSIAAILLVSLLCQLPGASEQWFISFRTIVVYSISVSLIISSIMQYSFSRFIADRCYENKKDTIRSNYYGICIAITAFSIPIAFTFVYAFLNNVDPLTKSLVFSTIVILSLVWVSTISLSGVRAYRQVSLSFLLAYGIIVVICYLLRFYMLNGLLLGFFIGQCVLFALLFYTIHTQYPGERKLSFAFAKKLPQLAWLVFAGFFYNFAIWIDKYIFWFSSKTGSTVIGGLKLSLTYDAPIFIATLSSIFSMAFFFLHLETNYIRAYKQLFDEICFGATLRNIYETQNILVASSRYILGGVLKLQGILLMIGVLLGSAILRELHVDPFYIYILNILIIALTLNVLYWSLIDLLFHLDKYKICCFLHLFFFISNAAFTWISIQLNIFFYGYGLALSLLCSTILALWALNNAYKNLTFEVFCKN